MTTKDNGPSLAFAALAAMLIAAPAACAATFYVATTGNDANPGTQASPFRTIAMGIASAANGDTVQVGAGTFNENLTWNDTGLSLNGAGASIINGGGTVACLILNTVPATALVNGFTFRSNARGIVNHASGVTVSNCAFEPSTSGGSGGMTNDAQGGPCLPTITNCTFTGNAQRAMSSADASPTVVNCTFTNNTGGRGGAFYCSNGDPTLTGCTFTGNSSVSDGGGAVGVDGGSARLTGCAFTNNTFNNPVQVLVGGGAVYSNSSMTVTGCTFTGNVATGAYPGYGGGIFTYTGLTVSRCLFRNNSA